MTTSADNAPYDKLYRFYDDLAALDTPAEFEVWIDTVRAEVRSRIEEMLTRKVENEDSVPALLAIVRSRMPWCS